MHWRVQLVNRCQASHNCSTYYEYNARHTVYMHTSREMKCQKVAIECTSTDVSVMQAGVTCTRNHDLAPELATYVLTQSFSYASHQCGQDSPSPITIYIWSQAGRNTATT